VPRLPATASCSRDGWELFVNGCTHILESWDLLHTAVVEEWGGRGSKAKLDHIISDLVLNSEEQWRHRHDLHVDTLDVYLLECLEGDFGVEFENDEEVTAVSELIQKLYRECAEGELDAARSWLRALAKPEASRSKRVTGAAGDDEDSCSESEEDGVCSSPAPLAGGSVAPSRPKHVVDEDGWETVVAPRKKGAGGESSRPSAPAVLPSDSEQPAGSNRFGSLAADTDAEPAVTAGSGVHALPTTQPVPGHNALLSESHGTCAAAADTGTGCSSEPAGVRPPATSNGSGS
jgi:hypothetical protein